MFSHAACFSNLKSTIYFNFIRGHWILLLLVSGFISLYVYVCVINIEIDINGFIYYNSYCLKLNNTC